jgi:ABC-type uncharacterized transport system substrate-binding protein
MKGTARNIIYMTKLLLTFVIFFLFCGSVFAQNVTIVYQKGTPIFEETAQATRALVASKVFIPVERDKEDEAKGSLSAEKDSIVCAIGPTAITTAFQAGSLKGVAVGLPNPLSKNYSTKKDFVFVSLYPDPKAIFDYLSKTNSARNVGIIFTNSVNLEMADYFKSQAENSGLKCKLLGVDSAQDLVAPFPYFLGQVDIVLLLIDPLSYNKEAVKFIVTKAIEKKKPVFGFSETICSAGIPVSLFVPSSELAKITAKAVEEKKAGASKTSVYFGSDFKLSINVEAAKAMGVKYDESKVVTRF